MITVAGADRVLTMDLHQGQIQGFFNIPVDELTAVHMLSNYFRHKHLEDPVVVTDLGFAKRARAFAELLDAPLAIIEKRRVGNLDRAELMNVIGDVGASGRSSSTTRSTPPARSIEIVRALEREGVTEMYACATHGVLSDPAIDRIRDIEPARGRHHRLRPAAAGQAHPADHDPVGRAAHRRGDQAHPSRRVGRVRCSRARSRSPRRCSSGTRVPSDGPGAGGTGRTSPHHDPRRDLSPRQYQPTDEPPAPPPRRRGRPRAAPVTDPTGAPAPLAAVGLGLAQGSSCRTSRTREMNPTSTVRSASCSGSASAALTFVLLVVGYGYGVLVLGGDTGRSSDR